MNYRRLAAALLGSATCILPFAPARAQGELASVDGQGAQDLSHLSIEELAQLPVRSASKREEPLARAPTSLFVITGADIARSPATSLPEVLRLAPNLQVQRINAHDYAISARGFNGYESSNKLLVLMDGRSLYSTLHSGVFWDLRQPMLEDIEQIEVISGPGGTLYGPNAVNGVINVTTRDSRETLGGVVGGTWGNRERTLALRYGFPLGERAGLRIYGNAFGRDGLPDGLGPDIDDSISGYRIGFRSDFAAGRSDFIIQGDYFADETDVQPGDGNRGGNLTLRWSRDLDGASSLQVQAYYDHFRRRFQLARDALETLDFDAQYNRVSGSHDIVAGVGVRTTRDEFVNNANPFGLDPPGRRLWVLNVYVQDRFALSPELSLIAGVKLERSSFSGVEILPNLRIAWQPDPSHLLWAAVSRAVRTPSRIDRDLMGGGVIVPAPEFDSEKLVAFEAGYRGQPTASTSLSINLFYNLYDDIRTASFIGNPLPAQLSNNLTGHTYGFEAWGSWQVLPWWRLSAGALLLRRDFHLEPGTTDISGASSLGDDPGYQFTLRSAMNLGPNVLLDIGLRAVDGLEAPAIPSYVEAEARLGWMATERVELYVAGSNLLHRRHAESNDTNRAQLVERSASVGARWRF